MLKYTDERGNVIYAHKNPEKMNIHINFGRFSGCAVYLAPEAYAGGCTCITACGDGAAVFVGNANCGSLNVEVYEQSVCYIGNGTTMHSLLRPQRIRVSAHATVFVGDECMFSEDIDITTSDWHPIYETDSGKRVNSSRSVFIGDYVWLARNTTILKGSCMASGSVLGASSVLAGKYCPPNSIHAGAPAKIRGIEKFWGRVEAGESATEQQREMGIFQYDAEAVIRPCDIACTLKSLVTSHEKLAFLYDAFYCKADHNRFAWKEEEANARDGVPIPWQDSFEEHAAGMATVSEDWESPLLRTSWCYLGDDSLRLIQLQALWLKRNAIRRQYRYCDIMLRICWGKRKAHYTQKKAYLHRLLRQIRAYEHMMKAAYK